MICSEGALISIVGLVLRNREDSIDSFKELWRLMWAMAEIVVCFTSFIFV